jgi:hypothetical protein
MSPFAALPLALQQSYHPHWWGMERKYIFIPPMPSIPVIALIPSFGLIGPALSLIFLVLLYLPTSELVKMS